MDHCVLKDEMVPLTEMMRCRRIIFSLIPPKFDDEESEQQYLNKFQRLLEYLSKLRDKDECEEELGVVIQLKKDPRPESETRKWHGTIDKMKRFQVKLRRGKNDPIEWIEIAVDSVFDTQRSYRILISWLVATSSKVETQIHLLQRRCNQFGLNLTPVPQASISRDIFLNPVSHLFVLECNFEHQSYFSTNIQISVPLMVCVRNVPGASKIPAALLELFDFCDDGRHMTEPTFLQCVDGAEQFHFPLNRLKKIRSVACRQFVHRATRAVFIRIIVDEKGWAIVVFIINYNVVEQSELQRNLSKNVVEEVRTFLDGLAEKPN